MKENNFFDSSFKILFLFFWVIIWYKWVALSNNTLELFLVNIFSIASLLYIIFSTILIIQKKDINPIIIWYRISILASFVSCLFSFILYPTSLIYFHIKNILIIICIYISYKKLFTYKIEEGLVGIIASVLLLVMSFVNIII